MNTLKSMVGTILIGASAVIGYCFGKTIWENGLGEKAEKGIKKLFKKD